VLSMKYRFFAHLVMLAVAACLVPSASATWSGFRSLGKTPVIGEPSCAQIAASEVMCVARSQTGTLMANEFSKSAWSGWTDLTGTVTSDPSCVNDGSGNIVCAVRGDKYTLTAIVFDGKTWGAIVDSGEQVFSGTFGEDAVVSCALLHTGKVLCAARSVAGSVVASVFDETTWGKFSTAMTSATSAPGCGSDDNGDVICMANVIINNTNVIVVNRFDGSKWNGVIQLANGPGLTNSVCLALGNNSTFKGQEDCIAVASNSDVALVNHFNGSIWQGSDWSGFGQISGYVAPTTSCAPVSTGSIVCTWINLPDSLLYENTFNGTNWTGYVKVGGTPLINGPSCTAFSAGKTMCVVVGLNNQALSVTGP
jgi:hypothetical protein